MKPTKIQIAIDEVQEICNATNGSPENSYFLGIKLQLEMAKETIEQFSEDFKNDPFYTLDWGDDSAIAAARFKAAQTIIRTYRIACDVCEGESPDVVYEKFKDMLLSEALDANSHVPRSSSQSGNLVNKFYQSCIAIYAKQA